MKEINFEDIEDRLLLPNTVYLEVTNCCNAKCHMCPNKTLKRGRGVMAWELFKDVIDRCKSIEGKDGLNIFLHHQGEPLLDPMLIDRILYAKKTLPKSFVSFNSNAGLLTKEKSKQIIEAGLDQVTISIDAASKETYPLIRNGLDYDTTIQNVNDLIKLRNEAGSKMKITLQMVTCDINKHEVSAFKESWKEKGVRITIKPMHSFLTQGTSTLSPELQPTQILPCMQPFMFMFVYWNGDLGVCCWDADKYFPELGNITYQSIESAFNSPMYKKIRKAMSSKKCKELRPCNTCSQIYGLDMNVAIFRQHLRLKKIEDDD